MSTMRKQALYAAPVGALLAAGLWSGSALATEPAADCTAAQQQLTALRADLDGAIAADNAAGAATDSPTVTDLKARVQVTLGVVEQACSPDPTGTPEQTTPAPAPPLYADCAAAVAAGAAPIVRGNGEPGYRPELDRDGDGIACEANEADPSVSQSPTDRPTRENRAGSLGGAPSSGSGTVDSIPSGSVDTGYVAP